MHGHVVRTVRRRRGRERGAVAVMVSLVLTALLVVSALVLDFGLVRVDRQVNKSAADAATLAGLQTLGKGNDTYPFRGVCQAIDYLRENATRFSTVSGASGTWTDGNGAPKANGCTTASLQAQKCVAGSPASWAKFVWIGTYQGEPLRVTIQSGYQLSGSGWQEESLPAAQADNDDDAQGCNQLAVIITQNRDPGFGSLATSSDIVSHVRSVGRVETLPGMDAPAMLLLRRTGCPILQTGSSGGGSVIRVYGAATSDGATSPGSIHADSDGTSCTGGSNQSIFLGKSNDGIAAFAAPLASNTTLPDPAKPGQLTTVAGTNGITGSVIRDNNDWAYAASGIDQSSPGTKGAPTGRDLVTRSVVDNRYLGLGPTPKGVRAVVNAANSVFAATASKAAALAATYKLIDGCTATSAEITAIAATDKVYVNCTSNSGYSGVVPIIAEEIVFAGSVKPPSTAGTSVSLPNAKRVYIHGDPTKSAIDVGNNSAFKVNTGLVGGNVTGAACNTGVNPSLSSIAVLVVKSGEIKQTGGLLQMCRTTVVMMGNNGTGCLPTSTPTPPTSTPCGGGTGDGQISLSGSASIDWTAPNTLDKTTDAMGNPTPAALTAWSRAEGPEDLALWTESAGLTSSPTYSIGGSGSFQTVGVFMAPNAAPFTIGGGSTQNLTNAQYIATSIALNGTNTSINMSVDPYAAVTIPRIGLTGLVR